MTPEISAKRVAILVADGFEQVELEVPRRALKDAGFITDIVSPVSGLSVLGYHNVDLRLGDGLAGAPDRAPFDRIVITAATEMVPQLLVEQLARDGVMVLPLGPHTGPQNLVRLTKSGDGIRQEALIAVRFVPLLPGQAREL